MKKVERPNGPEPPPPSAGSSPPSVGSSPPSVGSSPLSAGSSTSPSSRPASPSSRPATPSSRSASPSSRPPPSSVGGPDRERDLLLYVEDDNASWYAAEQRLKRSYNLIRAANDREACAALVQHGDRLIAILMDIELAGSALDGLLLTKLIRGKLGTSDLPPYAQAVRPLSAPILFVVSPGSRTTEPELIAAGASRVLTKPIDFVQLTSALTHLRLQRVMDLSSPWKDA